MTISLFTINTPGYISPAKAKQTIKQVLLQPATIWAITKWLFMGMLAIQGGLTFWAWAAQEAVQGAMFPLFPLTQNNQWRDAEKTLERAEPIVRLCVWQIRKAAKFNIISGVAWRLYADAAEMQLEVQKRTVATMLGKTAFMSPSSPDMVVYITTRGKFFHPPWGNVPAKFKCYGIALSEAQRRGLKPSKDWWTTQES